MDIKEIEAWRTLYPEICKKDGLWQESPKPFYPEEMLVAIRNIDYLLSRIKELEEVNLELKEEIEKHIKPGSYMSSYGMVYPSHHMVLAKLVKKV